MSTIPLSYVCAQHEVDRCYIYESCLLHVYTWVRSLIHLYISHVSYTSTHESCLLYMYAWVPSIIHLYMSHVFYTSIYESCLLYIYIWVMSPIHIYMSRVSYTSIYESCLLYIYTRVMSSPLPTSGSIPVCHHSETSSGHDWLRCHLWENPI